MLLKDNTISQSDHSSRDTRQHNHVPNPESSVIIALRHQYSVLIGWTAPICVLWLSFGSQQHARICCSSQDDTQHFYFIISWHTGIGRVLGFGQYVVQVSEMVKKNGIATSLQTTLSFLT